MASSGDEPLVGEQGKEGFVQAGSVGVCMCMYICMSYTILTFQTFEVGVGAVEQ